MSEVIKRAKCDRTIAKRTFNGLIRRIRKAIDDESPNELLDSIIADLRDARKDLANKHREFLLASVTDDVDDNSGEEDTYLEEAENDFRSIEQTLFQYLQSIEDRKQQNSLGKEEVAKKAKIAANESENEKLLLSLHNIRSIEAACLETELARALLLKDTYEVNCE